MESSCRSACTVCAQSTPRKELIANQLFWNEPFDSIQTVFRVSPLDLDRHAADDPGITAIRKTNFPFFENAEFLLLNPTNAYDYLVWIRDRVRRPVSEADKRFCVLVGFVAESFLHESNLQTFLEYSNRFAAVQKVVANAQIKETPNEVFLSDEGLNSIPDHWLQTVDGAGESLANWNPDWKRLSTYGHGAVTLHQIALLADKEFCADGMRLSYTEEAKSRWTERVFWAWLRLKFWTWRLLPVMREKKEEKKEIDVAYHALRVSFPFDPPGAAALHRDIKRLSELKKEARGNLSPKDMERLSNAQSQLDGLYSAMPELQNWKLAKYADEDINRKLIPHIQHPKFSNLTKFRRPNRKESKKNCRPQEYLHALNALDTLGNRPQHDEIVSIANAAVGEAAVQDRANTPQKDWYLKLWRDFERGEPAPIVVRVNRDISDQLRREWREMSATEGYALNKLGPQGKVPDTPSRKLTSSIFQLTGSFQADRTDAQPAKGSETVEDWKQMRVGATTILDHVDFKNQLPWEFTVSDMMLMKSQLCRTPEERAIWQAKIDDPGAELQDLQSQVYFETGKDVSLQYIWQIASRLKKRAKKAIARR
jgi:hypothetical protein